MKLKRKKLVFKVEFVDNKEVEELIRKIVGCLNTSESKVTIKESK